MTPPEPVKPRIVSVAHGSIDHVLLTYPRYVQGELSYERVYADLLAKLPKRTEVTIFVHPQVEADLQRGDRQTPRGGHHEPGRAPDFLNFTVWAEDPYVVIQDTDPESTATYLMEPFTFNRSGDALIAERIAQASPFQSTQSPLYFQGGNVLIGDDFVMLGIDYLYNTLDTFRTTGAVSIPAGVEPFDFVTGLFNRTFGETDAHVLPRHPPAGAPAAGRADSGRRQPVDRTPLHRHRRQAADLSHRHVPLPRRAGVPTAGTGCWWAPPPRADRILGRRPSRYAMQEVFDDIAPAWRPRVSRCCATPCR